MIKVWNEFRICEQFSRFPRDGGYERQSPKKMEMWNIINRILSDKEKNELDKQKLHNMRSR